MVHRFHILGSSSSGNSALLVTETSRILVDAGFSGRQLDALLRAAGTSLDAIDAVFFTHEHGDHSRGLPALLKRAHIRLFANRATARVLGADLQSPGAWEFFENGRDFRFRDLLIHPFAIPHDAADPVAFRFTAYEGTLFETTVAWITDLGHVPAVVHRHASSADILVLEANYDPDLLDASGRPLSLKQRIRGRHGHLSNADAVRLLESIEGARLKRVYLGHLSRECNRAEIVSRALSGVREKYPLVEYIVVDPDASPSAGA